MVGVSCVGAHLDPQLSVDRLAVARGFGRGEPHATEIAAHVPLPAAPRDRPTTREEEAIAGVDATHFTPRLCQVDAEGQ